MYKFNYVLLLFLIACVSHSQNEVNLTQLDTISDTKYREDQFYIGATYNALINKPNNVSQSGFSTGIHFGFLRDFPVNKKRTYAIAVGLGMSFNSFIQNLALIEQNPNFEFTVINENQFQVSKNKFNIHMVELPIEFRWRNSIPTEYKFWRIYPGFKLGYVFANSSKFEGELGTFNYSNLDSIDNLQYGATLSTGYNTWNFHVYYGLNSIFNNKATLNNNALNLSVVKVGLYFYLL